MTEYAAFIQKNSLLNFSTEVTVLIFFSDKKTEKIKGIKNIESFVSNIFKPSAILMEYVKLKPYKTNTKHDRIKSVLFIIRFFEPTNIIRDITPRPIINSGLNEGGIKIIAEKLYINNASNLSIIFFILLDTSFIDNIICHKQS